MMTGARIFVAMLLLQAVILFSPEFGRAQSTAAASLSGRVSSQEEDPMEGVLVSAKREGSTIRVTVATDQQGRYSFPRNRLEPGKYSLNIRAVGYEMDPADVQVNPSKAATADLKLRKTKDLAAQLTNAEWLHSMPPDDRKNLIINCAMCHTLQRIVYSKHNVEGFLHAIERMNTYYIGSSPEFKQFVPAFVRNPPSPERHRKGAEFMETINLSKVSKWEYPLKTFPRPTGRATRMIVTEYDLPSKRAQPHDVIIGSDGMAWYMDFNQALLGKLDPKTGRVTEYPVPALKSEQPSGGLGIEEDKAGNIWLALMFQGGVAKFDRKTGQFQTYPLPKEMDSDTAQLSRLAASYATVDGKVWVKDTGVPTQIKRLDIATGKYETAPPFPKGQNVYGINADTQNNCYFMDLSGESIGRVDAKTLQVTQYRTPTRDSGPRRGHVDSQDRLWFAEWRGNKVAVFDPRTEQFQEWAVPTPWSNPYDAIVDKNGEAWAGGMNSDRIVRVNSKTGQITEYLLPEETNVRKVWVDNSTTPVTFWVGNDHHATIIKLEPLD